MSSRSSKDVLDILHWSLVSVLQEVRIEAEDREECSEQEEQRKEAVREEANHQGLESQSRREHQGWAEPLLDRELLGH